jgi:hypothetical protein
MEPRTAGPWESDFAVTKLQIIPIKLSFFYKTEFLFKLAANTVRVC